VSFSINYLINTDHNAWCEKQQKSIKNSHEKFPQKSSPKKYGKLFELGGFYFLSCGDFAWESLHTKAQEVRI
jgi:hypothetical protein